MKHPICIAFLLKVFFKFQLILIAFITIINFSCSVNKNVSITKTADTITKTQVALVDTEFYAQVEKPATFEGDFKTYLKKNVKYPLTALKKKQQGLVVVQFGVDCYGSTKVFSVLKSSGSISLDNEAKRAITASPKWTPAKADGKSVGQLMMIQIRFRSATKSIEII